MDHKVKRTASWTSIGLQRSLLCVLTHCSSWQHQIQPAVFPWLCSRQLTVSDVRKAKTTLADRSLSHSTGVITSNVYSETSFTWTRGTQRLTIVGNDSRNRAHVEVVLHLRLRTHMIRLQERHCAWLAGHVSHHEKISLRGKSAHLVSMLQVSCI